MAAEVMQLKFLFRPTRERGHSFVYEQVIKFMPFPFRYNAIMTSNQHGGLMYGYCFSTSPKVTASQAKSQANASAKKIGYFLALSTMLGSFYTSTAYLYPSNTP